MNEPLFLLGGRTGGPFHGLPHDTLSTVEAVRAAYSLHRRARWVVLDAKAILLLTNAVQMRDTWHRLLVLEQASTPRRELLHALFRVVVAPEDGVRLLPQSELAEVMADDRADDLLIGGVVDADDKAVVLYRGNLERLVVPFAWFKVRPRGPRPDFKAFAVIDFGQTVQLGDYEASVDAILADFDADARKRMRSREIAADSSFGGALRRLRLQRGLARSDFSPLDAKTIARIERGDVDAPHADTLAVIAKRLGVNPGEIASH